MSDLQIIQGNVRSVVGYTVYFTESGKESHAVMVGKSKTECGITENRLGQLAPPIDPPTCKTCHKKVEHLGYPVNDLIEIHTTDRNMFKQCRQKWDFYSQIRHNLEPEQPSDAFWLGTGFHRAIAEYYNPENGERLLNRALVEFRDYCQQWLDTIEEPSEEQKEWLDGMMDLGFGMLKQYVDFAEEDDKFTVLEVERTQIASIPGLPGVLYSFRCDGVVEDEYGRLWILEHKTTASVPQEEHTDWLMMDDQPGSYLFFLQQKLGREIEGVIYNFIKKKVPVQLKELKAGGFSVDKRQDTTYKIARNQLIEHYGSAEQVPDSYYEYMEYLKEFKMNAFVRRERVRRNQRELAYLGNEIQFEARDMIDPNVKITRTPSKANCSHCPFFPPCLQKWSGDDPEATLELMYKSREDANV